MNGLASVSARALPDRSFLAFDYGLRRVGVATGNTVLAQARALKTLDLQGPARMQAILALIQEWKPDALVVGIPFHPDGAAHENTLRARKFARQLHGRTGLPVHEVDERYSTVEAARDAQASAGIDAASAAVILQQYLQEML